MTTLALANNYPIEQEQQHKAIALRNKLLHLNKPKYLLAVEVQKLFSYIQDNNHLMYFQFLWNTGARKQEALNITKKDIDLDNKLVIISTLKQTKPAKRIVPIVDEYFLKLLHNYIDFRQLKKDDKLFNYSSNYINQMLNGIVLKASQDGFTIPFKVTPHTFRHSFAIHLLYNGLKPIQVRKLLGHSDLKNTMIYLDMLASDLDFSNVRFNY